MGALAEALRRWRQAGEGADGGEGRGVDERAGCAFGLVTRRALDDLEGGFRRLEAKIDGLLFAVALAVVLELWKAWRG